MTLLKEYIEKEQLLRQIRNELLQLEQDQRLKSDLEFKRKLESLMREHGKNTHDIIGLLDPETSESSLENTSHNDDSTVNRRKRKLKVYKNPHTDEIVETRGGNHKTLKAWKEQFGNETVESWVENIAE